MAHCLLLQGGTVLIHDDDDHVNSVKADVLIEGNIISKIEWDIQPSPNTEVIDCTNKLISPGFIDTHHHVWQTLLKGGHANELLLDYYYSGNFTSSLHNPEDIFWGQLGGVLECLDVGTTTVVDHAHFNYSPEHSKAAIAATVSSGIRSIFGYCPTTRLDSWSPFTINQDILADWVINTLDQLASKAPFGSGRVQLGLAFDGLWLPKEIVVGLFEKVKALGIKLITLHYVRVPIFGLSSSIALLNDYGLLDSSILISHAANATAEDAVLLLKTNSHVSSTPSTELQMALGTPVAFQSNLGIQHRCSVGIDCHATNSASVASELRLLLQSSRGTYNEKFVRAGLVPKAVNKTVEEAFNLGTIAGARAINMQDKIGSLKVGKLADILVWDAVSPAMVCAADIDPVGAVVLHSSPADIEMVIVDGVVRKRGGKLVNVDVAAGRELWDRERRDQLQWEDISKELVKRRRVMQEKVDKLDEEEAKRGIINAFHIDESKFVEKI